MRKLLQKQDIREIKQGVQQNIIIDFNFSANPTDVQNVVTIGINTTYENVTTIKHPKY